MTAPHPTKRGAKGLRAPESRLQNYLEIVLAREDHVQEVKLFGLGPLLLKRYREIFLKIYSEDRALTLRRESWGLILTLIGVAALYGAYIWIVMAAKGCMATNMCWALANTHRVMVALCCHCSAPGRVQLNRMLSIPSGGRCARHRNLMSHGC